MNLTDVDDRIIANAAAQHLSIRDYTEKFVQASSTIAKPSASSPRALGRATDNIDSMVQLIQRLQEKTYTYPSEGSIYYRIAKFPTTESSPKSISPASKPAPESTTIVTKKKAPAILRSESS